MVAWKNVQDYEKIEKGGPKRFINDDVRAFFWLGAAHTHFLCHKISQEDGKGNQPTPVTVCPCHTSRGAQCIFHRGLLHLSASTYLYTVKIKPVQPRVSKTHGYILSKYANVC